MKKRYCSIKEVSEYTGLSTGTLYEWAGTRRIPSIKIGRRVLFDLQDIDQAMTDCKRSVDQTDKIAAKIIREIVGNEI